MKDKIVLVAGLLSITYYATISAASAQEMRNDEAKKVTLSNGQKLIPVEFREPQLIHISKEDADAHKSASNNWGPLNDAETNF